MQKYRIQTKLVVALNAILILCSLASASSQQKTNSASDISLTIQAVSGTVKVGAPVWVDVTETNNSNKVLPIGREKPLEMDQGGVTFKVDVWDGKGVRCAESAFYRKLTGYFTPEERAAGIEQRSFYNGFAILVDPGKSVKDRIDVGRLYDLSHPGTYTIQVQFFPSGSNKITITVIP